MQCKDIDFLETTYLCNCQNLTFLQYALGRVAHRMAVPKCSMLCVAAGWCLLLGSGCAVILWMLLECGFQPQQIVEEYPVNINGMSQRADIVAMDCEARPVMVVECKEPNVRIDQAVLDQVVRYNSVLGCRYIVISNGLDTYCYRWTQEGGYTPLNHFPHFAEL